MQLQKGVSIFIDPTGAQTGGRVVKRELKEIGDSAISTQQRIDQLTRAQEVMAKSAQDSFQAMGQAQDALRAKFNPTYAVLSRYKQTVEEIRMAHRVGALSVNEMSTALSRERQAALSAVQAIKGYSAALAAIPSTRNARARVGAFETANLAAQFQDIAVTSAMGMSPLQIALQQGTQLSAVLGPMGASGAVKGLGAAFASLLNPVSLITIGLTAGTAALIQYFTTASSGAKDIDTILANHAENIRALKGAYGEAAAGLKDYVAESKATLAANAKENLDATLDLVRDAAQSELREALNLPASDFAGNINVVNQFAKAINSLETSMKSGTPDLIAYRSALSEIAVSDAASASQKALANTLRALDEDDLKAVQALPGMLKAVSVAAGESAGGLDRLQSIDLSQTTQGVTSLGTALQTVSQTAQGTASTVIDVAQQAANSQRQTLQSLQQSSSQLRTMKTELSDIQKALADAAKTPVSEVFGAGISGQAAGAIDAAASSIKKVFAALNEGRITALTAHESLELIRQSLHQLGGDTASIDKFMDAMTNAYLRVGQLESGVKSLSSTILGIPNRVIDIGIRQYQVPASGGGTTGVNVYGGNADFSYQSYNVGGKTIGVAGGNGYYGRQTGYLVEQSDLQAMYDTLGYGGARAAGGPVEAGKRYLVGEQGPELITMSAAGHVSNANTTASILSGGRDTLSLIEDHLYAALQELRIHTEYLSTAESDTREMITCLQALKSYSSGSASYSSSAASGGSYSGGRSSGSSGSSHLDPYSAYYFNAARNFAGTGGGRYDPVADAMLNGNTAALNGVSGGPTQGIARLLSGHNMPSLLDRLKRQVGFANNGQIMAGEDQKVEFFKRNKERVIIVDDNRVSDQRGAQPKAERPINLTVNFNGGDVRDQRSQQAAADQFRRVVQQVQRS
ncbi:phage tail length tape measure family protein [Sinorhizobium fredii]|uniref:phage tail length tape measure family protein n=1 Tax=Rhizobium fredii TaxID=380 RepID=UPI0035142E4B